MKLKMRPYQGLFTPYPGLSLISDQNSRSIINRSRRKYSSFQWKRGVMRNHNEMKNEEIEMADVPFGAYCYGYVPTPESGFSSKREADKFLNEKFSDSCSDEEFAEHEKILVQKFCKFWNPTEFGFVFCSHLKIRALWISDSEDSVQSAIKFFGSEEVMEQEITGCLLGDAVKECKLNRCGPDFSFEK